MAKAVQMLDSEMISRLDIAALARQGNPSEELNLQVGEAETFWSSNSNSQISIDFMVYVIYVR